MMCWMAIRRDGDYAELIARVALFSLNVFAVQYGGWEARKWARGFRL